MENAVISVVSRGYGVFISWRTIDVRLSYIYNKEKEKEGLIMPAITITKARENLYNVVKEVHDNAEPVLIVNSRGKNVVMISEE